jgi:hypothetical protein
VLAEFVRAGAYGCRSVNETPAPSQERLGLPFSSLHARRFQSRHFVFKPQTVDPTPPKTEALPGGYDYVIVNGAVVIDQEQNTPALCQVAPWRGHASTLST